MGDVLDRLAIEARKQRRPYECGFDAGKNGANTENCHFSIFSTPESTKEWERGNRAGLAAREARAQGGAGGGT